MGTVAFRLSDGVKRFGTPSGVTTAFAGLDLEAADGELLALLGPSGCGKSTLLRVLVGLDELSDGNLEISRHSDGRPDAGIVFQEPHLLPWSTVHDNVALGLRYRANRHVDPGRVDELLCALGLAELADAMPAELSGGQAQRVAVARTVVTEPPLLLLDEPFAALDPLTRRALQDWLREIADLLELTVVLVTHDVDEALHLGDRVVLLRGGHAGLAGQWDASALHRDTDGLDTARRELLTHYAGDGSQETFDGAVT